jgi:hypothetical protein
VEKNSHEQFHNLYSSPNIRIIKSKRMRMAKHVVHMWEMRYAYKISVGKPETLRRW